MRGDGKLLDAWRQGDARAGRELYDRHFPAIYRFFCNKVEDVLDDLVQETFLACVEGRDRIDDDEGFRRFIFVVARNRLYKHWRSRERHDRRFDLGVSSVEDLRETPSRVVGRQRRDDLLLLALRKIPAELQLALELFYWEEMSAAQIGAVLEVPEGTVRSRLRRARDLLAERLAEVGAAPGELGEDLAAWARRVRDQLDPPDGDGWHPSNLSTG